MGTRLNLRRPPGFVLTVLHGPPRPTAGIDVLFAAPGAAFRDPVDFAGEFVPVADER